MIMIRLISYSIATAVSIAVCYWIRINFELVVMSRFIVAGLTIDCIAIPASCKANITLTDAYVQYTKSMPI